MGTLKSENFVKKIRYSSFWWLSTVLRIALITDDRCLSLGLCLKSQSLLLLTPTFVTVLRIALFADARSLFLGLCLKAQSPLLLTPSFVTIDERQKVWCFLRWPIYVGVMTLTDWNVCICASWIVWFDTLLWVSNYISAGLWLCLFVCLFPQFCFRCFEKKFVSWWCVFEFWILNCDEFFNLKLQRVGEIPFDSSELLHACVVGVAILTYFRWVWAV